MNQTITRIVVIFFSVFILVYIAYQAIGNLYIPYEAEIVTQSTYQQSVDLDGFFVRSEKILPQSKSGIISYPYKNAQKVPKDAVIANVYQSEQDLYSLNKIELLESQLKILEDSQADFASGGLVKLDLLNKQIAETKLELISCVDNGDFSNLDQIHNSLMLNLDKFTVGLSGEDGYSSAISSLKLQIESIRNSISPAISSISTEDSGYFSSYVDNYESIFTLDMLEKLKISDVQQQLETKREAKTSSIGKIVLSDIWYFVSIIPAKQTEAFEKIANGDNTITLKFSSQSVREITASIEQVIKEEGNDKAVVIFKSNYMDDSFISMRFEKPKALLQQYTGILIPKESIRIGQTTDKDGNKTDVKGVYTLFGKVVRFKWLDIVYEDEYVLISKPNTSDKYVSIYDHVIVKGKDLHETTS